MQNEKKAKPTEFNIQLLTNLINCKFLCFLHALILLVEACCLSNLGSSYFAWKRLGPFAVNALEGLGTVCSECAWGCLGPFAVNAAEGLAAVCGEWAWGGLGPFAVNAPGGLGSVRGEQAWGAWGRLR